MVTLFRTSIPTQNSLGGFVFKALGQSDGVQMRGTLRIKLMVMVTGRMQGRSHSPDSRAL